MDDGTVADRLARLDETLGRLEQTPGATAETALGAVAMLTEVYGEALSRMMRRVSGDDAESLLRDDLVGHLLVLHGIHPEPVGRRIARALDGLRPQLGRQGVDVGFIGVEAGTAQVSMKGGGCGAESAEEAVREAVLAAAPELAGVHVAPPEAEPAFVPVDSLLRRPGPVVDGPVVDGPAVDGPVVDGPVVDGPVVDGPVVDGPVVDGAVVDGPAVDGPVVDGAAADGAV